MFRKGSILVDLHLTGDEVICVTPLCLKRVRQKETKRQNGIKKKKLL